MPHWRKFTDREWLYAEDLEGRDVTVTIESVSQGELVGEGGRKTRKPKVTFVGAKKPLALNATNAKTIAAMYGNKTEAWIGKRITLFTSTTEYGGNTTDCIRVRPRVPPAASGKAKQQNAEPMPVGHVTKTEDGTVHVGDGVTPLGEEIEPGARPEDNE